MAERDLRIQDMKERMNSVEDVVFKDFCTRIGMANIRQYEERELRLIILLSFYFKQITIIIIL